MSARGTTAAERDGHLIVSGEEGCQAANERGPGIDPRFVRYAGRDMDDRRFLVLRNHTAASALKYGILCA